MRRETAAFGQQLEDLNLPLEIIRDREGHQLFERDFVVRIGVVQLWRDSGELQALTDDCRSDEVVRGDRFDIVALVHHRLHGAKLVEGMQRLAHGVFRIAVVLGEDVIVSCADNAGDRRVPRE